jgi:hypothetical protein
MNLMIFSSFGEWTVVGEYCLEHSVCLCMLIYFLFCFPFSNRWLEYDLKTIESCFILFASFILADQCINTNRYIFKFVLVQEFSY